MVFKNSLFMPTLLMQIVEKKRKHRTKKKIKTHRPPRSMYYAKMLKKEDKEKIVRRVDP